MMRMIENDGNIAEVKPPEFSDAERAEMLAEENGYLRRALGRQDIELNKLIGKLQSDVIGLREAACLWRLEEDADAAGVRIGLSADGKHFCIHIRSHLANPAKIPFRLDIFPTHRAALEAWDEWRKAMEKRR